MGIQSRKSNIDRTRTSWTQEMHRYFIDLMLDQVTKGNKIDDNLFSKLAWKQMGLLFNAKFQFQYDQDILKNRYKTLRNLYRAVKNLLNHGGFSWDETRHMVVADNSVWDEYIKEHPDARPLRFKSIPYYGDLCTIYANPSGGQKGNGASELSPLSIDNGAVTVAHLDMVDEETMDALHDITINEEFGISVPQAVDGLASNAAADVSPSGISVRTRTYWEPQKDRMFIDLILDQIQKGNQVDGHFSKESWMEMLVLFNTKFGFNYDVDILKNRYKTLRRQYNATKNILKLDDFSWDDAKQKVIANDNVWQDYIKEYPDARQFMIRPVPYYKDLCVIWRDPNVDDREFFSCRNLEHHAEFHEVKDVTPISYHPPTSISSALPHHGMQDPGKDKLKTAGGVKRRSQDQSIGVNAKRLQDNNDRRDSVPEETVIPKRGSDGLSTFQIEQVVEAIQALPDMDEDLILDACDFLEDEKKAKTFMALDVKLRKKWLVRKLRS